MLLELLAHPEVTLRFRPSPAYGGEVDWREVYPPTCIKIKIDANGGDQIEFVIHELLHVVLHPLVIGRVDSTLEELWIVALAGYMAAFVKRSPERLAKWEKLIRAKLAESDAADGLKPLAVEELVDRTADDAREKKRGG